MKAANIIENKDIYFVYAWSGSGNIRGYISKTNVKIIKKPTPIEEFLQCADIIVFPHKHLRSTEFPPSSIMESMAAKKPVIASGFSELKEIFKDEKNIIFMKPRDHKDLANKIKLLIKNNDLQKKLIKNNLKIANNYDIKSVVKIYEEYYNEIITKRKTQ